MFLQPRHHSRVLGRCTFLIFFDVISIAGDVLLDFFFLYLYGAVNYSNARVQCLQPS